MSSEINIRHKPRRGSTFTSQAREHRATTGGIVLGHRPRNNFGPTNRSELSHRVADAFGITFTSQAREHRAAFRGLYRVPPSSLYRNNATTPPAAPTVRPRKSRRRNSSRDVHEDEDADEAIAASVATPWDSPGLPSSHTSPSVSSPFMRDYDRKTPSSAAPTAASSTCTTPMTLSSSRASSSVSLRGSIDFAGIGPSPSVANSVIGPLVGREDVGVGYDADDEDFSQEASQDQSIRENECVENDIEVVSASNEDDAEDEADAEIAALTASGSGASSERIALPAPSKTTASMGSALGGLYGTLLCTLCSAPFTRPQTLPVCNHSFCLECIVSHTAVSSVCPFAGCTVSITVGEDSGTRGGGPRYLFRPNPNLENMVASMGRLLKVLNGAKDDWWKDRDSKKKAPKSKGKKKGKGSGGASGKKNMATDVDVNVAGLEQGRQPSVAFDVSHGEIDHYGRRYFSLMKMAKKASSRPSSSQPSDVPSDVPSDEPIDVPCDVPSNAPSDVPSDVPSDIPSDVLCDVPSSDPSSQPSKSPSVPVVAAQLQQKAEEAKAAAYELHRTHNSIKGITERDVKRAENPLFQFLLATEGGKVIKDCATSLGTLPYCAKGADGGLFVSDTLCLPHYHPIQRLIDEDNTIHPMDVSTDTLTEPIWRFIQEYLRDAEWGSAAACRTKAQEIVSNWNIVDITPLAIDKELLTNNSKLTDLIQAEIRDSWTDSIVELMLNMHNLKQVVTVGSDPGRFALEVIQKFNKRVDRERRLASSAVHALTHSEHISANSNLPGRVDPVKLLWYCEGVSTVAEAITRVSLPDDGTSAEAMFFRAQQAGLRTPFNNGKCTIKEEAKKVESTIKKMKEDGEKEIGEGWMVSPSGRVYYFRKVPFSSKADAKAYEASRRSAGGATTDVGSY